MYQWLDWLDRQRDGVFWLVLYLVRWPIIIPVGWVQGLFAANVVGGSNVWKPAGGGGAALLIPLVVPPILETLIECVLPY